MELSLEQLVRRHLTLRGIHNYQPRHLLSAVRFLAERHGEYPFSQLVAEWHTLRKIDQAMQAARDPSKIRVGVRMPEGT